MRSRTPWTTKPASPPTTRTRRTRTRTTKKRTTRTTTCKTTMTTTTMMTTTKTMRTRTRTRRTTTSTTRTTMRSRRRRKRSHDRRSRAPAPGMDQGARPRGRGVRAPAGRHARPRSPHGLRGGALPQHRRLLEPGHGDLHDPRRRLHAGLRLLRGEDGLAPPAPRPPGGRAGRGGGRPPHQERHHGGPRRGARRGTRDGAPYSRGGHRHPDRRAVPATERPPPADRALLRAGGVRRDQTLRRRARLPARRVRPAR